MSVDISQLTARLDPQRQEAVKQQYEERATNPTAAFLLCFFLGSAGAHRFFLREWRAAIGHLALFAAGVVALVAGLTQTLPLTVNLASHPLGAALDALGVALLLAALIWEIIDLGHIDHQVYQRNLLLAEGIIAGTLLADHSLIEEARQRLSTTSRKARAQAQAAALASPAASSAAPAAPAAAAAPVAPVAGIITADEVADARALAEENAGFATISYAEMSRFDISQDPDQARQASADAAHEGNWSESVTTAETAPDAAPDAAPVTETVTRTHSEDGPRVTDSYEVDRVAGPSAAEAAGLGAAGLGAAALGAGLLGADHTASFDEPTQPDHTESAADAAPAIHAYDPSDAQPVSSAEPAATSAAPAAAAYQAAYQSDQAHGYDFADDDIGDVTDASMPAVVAPPADIAVAHGSPANVQLTDEQPAQDAPLYLIPDEPTTAAYPYASEPVAAAPVVAESAYDATPSEEPSAEAYVPPVASVYSSPTEAPVAPTPSWDQPTSVQPEPQPEPAHDDTLAELAGFGGAAGAGTLAGAALTHERAPEPAAAPTPEPVAAAPAAPKMKKIRVRRKVVVDGQVVAEEVVEREVPADMDTAEAAAQIQAELAHYTPEQIAQRANLSPDEEVELRQRTEGPGGAQ